MAAPNIVNVATITGISTFIAGINTGGGGGGHSWNPPGVGGQGGSGVVVVRYLT